MTLKRWTRSPIQAASPLSTRPSPLQAGDRQPPPRARLPASSASGKRVVPSRRRNRAPLRRVRSGPGAATSGPGHLSAAPAARRPPWHATPDDRKPARSKPGLARQPFESGCGCGPPTETAWSGIAGSSSAATYFSTPEMSSGALGARRTSAPSGTICASVNSRSGTRYIVTPDSFHSAGSTPSNFSGWVNGRQYSWLSFPLIATTPTPNAFSHVSVRCTSSCTLARRSRSRIGPLLYLVRRHREGSAGELLNVRVRVGSLRHRPRHEEA